MSDDKLIDGLEQSFGPMVTKPVDMPIDDFFKIMRKANGLPFDPKRMYGWEERFPYVNGTVWECFHDRRILTFLGGRQGLDWVFLQSSRSIVGGGACVLNAQHWEDGTCVMRHDELAERLKEWTCIGFWDGIEYPEVVNES
jgi:hypothetical protein